MLELIKKRLKEEHDGATTFEFAMTAPWLLAIMFVTFAFMMVCFSWASFSSLASNVASDLNVRQTGIARAHQMVVAAGGQDQAIKKFQVYAIDGDHKTALRSDQVKVNCSNATTANKLKDATIVAMAKNSKQFMFPFTSFDNITVTIKRPDGTVPSYSEATSLTSNNFASSIIQVDIHYKFLPVNAFNIGWAGFDMAVSAKSIVT